MKRSLILGLLGLMTFALGTTAFAVSGVGSVAASVTSNLAEIAKLITAASYVGGMAFVVAGIMKLKQHRENPTQVPVSTGIVFIFIGAALVFLPTVFSVSGSTLFGASGTVAGVSGITSFGAARAGG